MIVNGQSLSPVLSCSRCVTHNLCCDHTPRLHQGLETDSDWGHPRLTPHSGSGSGHSGPRQCEPHLRLRLLTSYRALAPAWGNVPTLTWAHLMSVILKRIFSNLIPDSKKFPTLSAIVDVFDHIHNKRIVLVQSFLANLISKQKSYSIWFWWSIDIVL